MGMNLMNIMKQVQNVQKKASIMQEELANLEIIGESANGAAKVTCDGQGKFKSIKLNLSELGIDSDTTETLEDIISVAMTDASDKASAEMAERMKKVTGGINIPVLNFGK